MSKRLTKYSKEYWINNGFSERKAEIQVTNFKLAQRKNKKICKEYWISRGFSEMDAKAQISLFQSSQSKKRKNKFTPSQKEFWIRTGLSEKEALKKVIENKSKNNSFQREFWIKRGLSKEEARDKISEIQKKNSSKIKNRKNGRTLKEMMSHGYSKQDALKKIKELQSTNSLNKYIFKFGEIKGEQEWKLRQINWQKTLNNNFSKSQRKKWSSFTYDDYIKKYGKNRADKWLKNKFIKNNKTYSNIQIKLFEKIDEQINKNFYFGENEYVIKRNKWTYIVDFYDAETKKIIEFYGDFWHANPNLYGENDVCNPWTKERANEIWERDKIRIQNLLNHNEVNDILIIWEYDFKQNTKQIINECINFLKNE